MSSEDGIFKFKKSNIHVYGTFLNKNCEPNTIHDVVFNLQHYIFNDIHFTTVLKKLNIDHINYIDEFLKLPEYDTFLHYYLDEESSIEDSDIILTSYNKFILLKKKEIGDELFRMFKNIFKEIFFTNVFFLKIHFTE